MLTSPDKIKLDRGDTVFFRALQSESPSIAGKQRGQAHGSIRARQSFAPAPRKAAANKKPPHVPVYTARFVT